MKVEEWGSKSKAPANKSYDVTHYGIEDFSSRLSICWPLVSGHGTHSAATQHHLMVAPAPTWLNRSNMQLSCLTACSHGAVWLSHARDFFLLSMC